MAIVDVTDQTFKSEVESASGKVLVRLGHLGAVRAK